MARKPPAFLTQHAKARWSQRLQPSTNASLHHGLLASAILIPDRHAVPLWGSWQAELSRRNHGSAGRSTAFRVTASAVLICRGRAVVTVYPLPVEHLAQVLVWLMLGRWVDD